MAQFPSAEIIDAPVFPAPTFGALAQLPVHDVPSDSPFLYAGVTFENFDVASGVTAVDFDGYNDCIRTAAKTFEDGLDYSESFQFSAYYARKCRTVGSGGEAEWLARVEQGFTQGESFFVARGLRDYYEANDTVLTAGADPRSATAALLQFFVNASYLPIIQTVPSLGFTIARGDGLLSIGAALVIDNGYGGGTPTATTEKIYGTGPVNIWRGGLISHVVPDLANNEIYAIAERQYAVVVQGGVASIVSPIGAEV